MGKINFLAIKLIVFSILLGIFCLGIYLTKNNQSGIFDYSSPEGENMIFREFINLTGEVKNPGIYELSDGTRLFEVIERAGGFTDNADQDYISKNINLSQEVHDFDKFHIPSIVESNSSVNGASLISLNNSSKEQLMSLPGVGPATADKIIAQRPFSSIEQLLEVSGIGEVKYSNIKDFVSL